MHTNTYRTINLSDQINFQILCKSQIVTKFVKNVKKHKLMIDLVNVEQISK